MRILFLLPLAVLAISTSANATVNTIDPRDYGAKCDGSTNDAVGINAALSYASTLGKGVVQIPPGPGCAISSSLSVPANVTLSGTGSGPSGGLIAKIINLNMISLAAHSSVNNLYINANSAGTNTSGTAISIGVVTGAMVENVAISGPFWGVDINGNSPSLNYVTINDIPSGGVGWLIGRLTTGSNTVDARITNSTIGGASTGASYDQIIYDSGGLFESNNDLLYADIGTYIVPGAGQQVIWSFFDNTVLGDTNRSYAFAISTSASSAKVYGLMCTNCWAASPQNPTTSANILINNGSGGSINGIRFVGSRIYTSAKLLAYINGGTNISFDSTTFCGAASTQPNMIISSGISGVAIRNSRVGGACDGQSIGGNTGIALGGGNTGIIINGVDFNGVATAVSGALSGDSVASGNSGMGSPAAIASGATITLPGVFPTYTISGTSTVSTINGAWLNRSVMLISTGGAVPFTTGGNICKALTSSQNVPVLATYLGTCWYLK